MHKTGFKAGEAAALIAPLMECDPDEIHGYVILAVLKNGDIATATNMPAPYRLKLFEEATERIQEIGL